ncbi:MAG: transcription antitermination factor NusB [Bacillota bacterium]
MTGLPARRAALKALERVRGGEPLDAALDRVLGALAEDDRRLAYEIAAGVLRTRTTLDARLAPLVPRGWDRVASPLQDVLRIGAYQLTGLDRVPPHAAVSTSVALAREAGGERAGGFVNAVLRQMGRTPAPPPASGDDAAALAAEYSHPEWLVRRWVGRFGAEAAAALLERNNTRPELVLQPARAPLDALRERWEAAGIRTRPAPYGAGLLTDRSRPGDLPGFAEGDFVVQDPAQALVAWFADLPPDTIAYDACAAPGGKTIALGRSTRGVVAADVSRSRARRLAENVRRAGSGREHVIVADARHPPVRGAGAVLVDAPCLGTGTFARHPDARWRVSPDALVRLAAQQAELLDAAADAVRPGGLLVYATCSLEPEENEQQVDRFLERHPVFHREPAEDFPRALLSAKGDLMILPHRHAMDGGFAARLRRA